MPWNITSVTRQTNNKVVSHFLAEGSIIFFVFEIIQTESSAASMINSEKSLKYRHRRPDISVSAIRITRAESRLHMDMRQGSFWAPENFFRKNSAGSANHAKRWVANMPPGVYSWMVTPMYCVVVYNASVKGKRETSLMNWNK